MRWGFWTVVVFSPLVVSGCAMAQWEQAINDAVRESLPEEITQLLESSTDIPLDLPVGTDIPSDWPSEVPVPEGEVIFSLHEVNTWNVAVVVAGEEVVTDALDALQTNGFDVVSEQDIRALRVVELSNGNYDVSFASIRERQQVVVNITVTTTPNG